MTWKHFKHYWPVVRESTNTWGRQMETFSALLALCVGNSPPPVNFPHKGQWRGTTMFSLICARINLSKQSWGWWSETPSRPLWRHRNGLARQTVELRANLEEWTQCGVGGMDKDMCPEWVKLESICQTWQLRLFGISTLFEINTFMRFGVFTFYMFHIFRCEMQHWKIWKHVSSDFKISHLTKTNRNPRNPDTYFIGYSVILLIFCPRVPLGNNSILLNQGR